MNLLVSENLDKTHCLLPSMLGYMYIIEFSSNFF